MRACRRCLMNVTLTNEPVTLLFFMKSLCACQFIKFSKAMNSYNIQFFMKSFCASILGKSSIGYSQFLFAK